MALGFLDFIPGAIQAVANAITAGKPAPEVAAARAARRLGHDAWTMAKHDGDLAQAKDRLEKAAALPGRKGQRAASQLVGVEEEIRSLAEIKAVVARTNKG